jgi:hypothetical protein
MNTDAIDARTIRDEEEATTNDRLIGSYANEQAEATQYIEGLIRSHIKTVVDSHQAMGATPRRLEWDMPVCLDGLRELIELLRGDGDVLLVHFLETVLEVRETCEDTTRAAIDFFVRFTVECYDLDEILGMPYVYSTIEHMLRIDADIVVEPASCVLPLDQVTSAAIHLGNDRFMAAASEILAVFWNTRLDSTCHTCHGSFVEEPPIRTFAFEEESISPRKEAVAIRIFNRHLACLKADSALFVPISHFWHDSIRTANASGSHHDAAAAVLIRTLEAIREGSADSYPLGVEFWHDYFSVPQWELSTKEQLLVLLPTIYSSAREILVHLSDVPQASVSWFVSGRDMNEENMSLTQVYKCTPPIIDIFKSEWMQRMWVVLEYYQCQQACIMDCSNKIWRVKDPLSDSPPFLRDTFPRVVNGALWLLKLSGRWGSTLSYFLSLEGSNLEAPAKLHSKHQKLCIGEALALIEGRQSQVVRDRFLAICIMSCPNLMAQDLETIPEDDTDTCLWVWSRALAEGDYSPLLLQSRFNESVPDTKPGMPTWLLGSRGMNTAKWFLGSQHKPPRHIPTVQGHRITACLHLVGIIETTHCLPVEHTGEATGVDWIIRGLVTMHMAEGRTLSVAQLIETLDRIFPLSVRAQKVAKDSGMALSYDDRRARDPGLEQKLTSELAKYWPLPGAEDANNDTLTAAQQIIDLLEFDKCISSSFQNRHDRLAFSFSDASERRFLSEADGEPICEVRCPRCRMVNLFRLDLDETAVIGDAVYRIPDLSYEGSLENGVGLVLRDGRVTGRMVCGPPACLCEIPEVVEIF